MQEEYKDFDDVRSTEEFNKLSEEFVKESHKDKAPLSGLLAQTECKGTLDIQALTLARREFGDEALAEMSRSKRRKVLRGSKKLILKQWDSFRKKEGG